MRIARAVALIFALMLAPWIEDRARDASSSGDAAFATTRRGPGDRETMTRFGASLVGALHDGNDTDHTVGVTVDADGNPIGDAVTQPARSMVGFVQDCSGFPPTQSGTLCGARGAYLHGHYLYVAATQVDTVSVVDVYRPDMPTVAGSVTDAKVLKGVVATWMHRSGEYLIAVARGRRPEGFGHVALIDVRWDRWRTDAAGRYLVSPRVVSHLANCSTDATRGLSSGRLCGARAVAVVDETAYVVSEMSNSLSVVVVPARLSKDFMGFEPPTIVPEFVGTLVDNRLEGAYAVAVNGANAYVASRWCKTCVVLVSLEDPGNPVVGGKLPRPGVLGQFDVVVSQEEAIARIALGTPLRGVEFVAKGVEADSAFAFVTTEFDGRVTTVDKKCVSFSADLGESVQQCALSARRVLYDLDFPADPRYEYRANARPNQALG